MISASMDVAVLLGAGLALGWEPSRYLPFTLLLVIALGVRGHYLQRLAPDMGVDLARIVVSVCIVGLVGLVGTRLLGVRVSDGAAVRAFLVSSCLLFGSRLVGLVLLGLLRRSGRLRRRVVIVGVDEASRRLEREASVRHKLGLDIVGRVDVSSCRDIRRSVRLGKPHLLIVSPTAALKPAAVSAVRGAATHGARVMLISPPASTSFFTSTIAADTGRMFSAVRVSGSPHPAVARRVKRALDLAASSVLLVLGLPLFGLLAVAVRLSGPGPILFRQLRVGQGGQQFELLKLRTMLTNEDSDIEWRPGSMGKITRVGAVLRRTGLDELPQLINVVRGEMSLVGPRPERPVFADHFGETIPGYGDRHRVPVGIAGLAQVMGFRGDTSIEERARLDNLYADTWSLALDLRIMYATVWGILRQSRNAQLSSELLAYSKSAEPHSAQGVA